METSQTLENPLLDHSFYENENNNYDDNNNDDEYMFDENGKYTGMFIAQEENSLGMAKRYTKNVGKGLLNELVLNPIPYNFFKNRAKVPVIPGPGSQAIALGNYERNSDRKKYGLLDTSFYKPDRGYFSYEKKPYYFKLPKDLNLTYSKMKTRSERDQFLKDLSKYFARENCSYKNRTEECGRVIQFFKENALHLIPKHKFQEIAKEGLEEGIYYDDNNKIKYTKYKPKAPIVQEAPIDQEVAKNATQSAGKKRKLRRRKTKKTRRTKRKI
jgi:hypothetical protein